MPPRVSVVMPVYNTARYLAEAVDSILAQTYQDFELVAVDDGSTDESAAVLRRYAARDPRVQVISRPNTGIVGALNDGLAAARGELVARMDSDDIAMPGRLARQVEYLDRHPDCVLVGASVLDVDSDGDPVAVRDLPGAHEQIDSDLLHYTGSGLVHPVVTMRAAAVAAVGGYRPEYLWTEDRDLFLRLAEQGKLANLPEVLLHYRLHPGSVNATRRPSQQANRARLVAETYGRRGVPVPLVPGPPAPMIDEPRAAYHRSVCYRALQSGHRATARKHVRRLVRVAPRDRRTWRLAADVYLGGKMAGAVKRII